MGQQWVNMSESILPAQVGLVIINFFKEQAAGGRCGTGFAAVFGGKDLFHIMRGMSALADFYQGACDNAHHLTKEAVAGEPDGPAVLVGA